MDDDSRPSVTELARLVKLMRNMQIQWFKGDKSTATLETAKSLERQVDARVAAILDDRPTLF